MPTLPGVEHRFAVTQKGGEGDTDSDTSGKKEKPTRRLEVGATQAESVFYKNLASEDPEGDCKQPFCPDGSHKSLISGTIDESLFSYVKTLTPAAIDLELRALVTIEGLSTFVNALVRRLRAHKDFDAVQTFMGVLLRMHGDVFVANPELREALEALREAQLEESRRVLDVISASLGTLSFVRDVL